MAIASPPNVTESPVPAQQNADEIDQQICGFFAKNPSKPWLISEVLERTGITYSLLVSQRMVELCRSGKVDRVAPALYRHPR